MDNQLTEAEKEQIIQNEWRESLGLPELPELPEKLPLFKKLPPGKPYPVEALGPILSGATNAIVNRLQCPPGLAAQSVLATASLVTQAIANVLVPESDEWTIPLSLYCLTIGKSGERKSKVDMLTKRGVNRFIRAKIDEHAVWAKLSKENKENTPEPLVPIIFVDEPTAEGLIKALCKESFMGMFSDEGVQLLGGYAMNKDNLLKTAGIFSKMWAGDSITRSRVTDGTYMLRERRVAIHWLVQPSVANNLFLGKEELKTQGLLGRFLIHYPESTIGTRFKKGAKRTSVTSPALIEYWERIFALFERINYSLDAEDPHELLLSQLTLDDNTYDTWCDYHDLIESKMNSDYSEFEEFAAKAPEQCLRIAGVLELVEHPLAQSISVSSLQRAIILTDFYLEEALRLISPGKEVKSLTDADKLLTWLKKPSTKLDNANMISIRDIYRLGPPCIRTRKKALVTLQILAEHGHVKEHLIGKKQYWEVL